MARLLVVICSTFMLSGNLAVAERSFQEPRLRSKPRDRKSERLEYVHSSLQVALGTYEAVTEREMQEREAKLAVRWQALPKNQQGRVNRASLYYIVDGYFTQQYGVSVVGLESKPGGNPMAQIDVLSHNAARYMDTVLKGNDTQATFGLDDAMVMVVVIEHFLHESDRDVLEMVFARRKLQDFDLSFEELMEALTDYMMVWMVGPVYEGQLLSTPSLSVREIVTGSIDCWECVVDFIRGSVKNFAHLRDVSPRRAAEAMPRHIQHLRIGGALSRSFSLEDGMAIVRDLSRSFGGFWRSEFFAHKEKLLKLEWGASGRVPLSRFHTAALKGEESFSESKEYLQTLGALDESSSSHGAGVIIPNYLQAISNCIIWGDFYHICFPKECEAHMETFEEAVGRRAAEPELLLSLVEEIIDDFDEDKSLSEDLRAQLQSIAQTHSGLVPLHSRLFLQWLHFAFPSECPFPHLPGTAKAVLPTDFGRDSVASLKEMAFHATDSPPLIGNTTTWNFTTGTAEAASTEWMTLWSHEEELLADSLHLEAPWEMHSRYKWVWMSVLGVPVVAVAVAIALRSAPAGKEDVLPTMMAMSKKDIFV
eukprot:CAMPEP_0170592294 /NCGR_PEP_ID=MMETSP0224-20130122/12850_1 /TAXON_ID=285029 /ORGANISM="Togula jolla, Strain CCCM 725" /LENGTH=591 /DNA_ID=CAMNT_0010916195 /DNA_START=65 /DNA_END=1840 /DNA_ORIENTATION=-